MESNLEEVMSAKSALLIYLSPAITPKFKKSETTIFFSIISPNLEHLYESIACRWSYQESNKESRLEEPSLLFSWPKERDLINLAID